MYQTVWNYHNGKGRRFLSGFDVILTRQSSGFKQRDWPPAENIEKYVENVKISIKSTEHNIRL